MRWMLLAAFLWATPGATQQLSDFRPELRELERQYLLELEKERNALSDLQAEYSSCIAHYNMEKACAPDDVKENVTNDLEPSIKKLTDRAYQIASRIGLTNDEMIARVKRVYDVVGERTGYSCFSFAYEYVMIGAHRKFLADYPASALSNSSRRKRVIDEDRP